MMVNQDKLNDHIVTLRKELAGLPEADRERRGYLTVEIAEGDQLYAQGAQVAVEVVELLLHNTRAHVADPHATVRLYQQRGRVVIEVQDAGEAIAPELRQLAFTLEGQNALKGRVDGRYSRFAGLFAAAVVLDGVGGTIEADGERGAAVFRVFLPQARPTRPPSP